MTLTTQQVTDLLARNGDLAALVQKWDTENYFLKYSQSAGIAYETGTEDFFTWLTGLNPPIPTYGIEILDTVYGFVDIFPSASNGTLLFNSVPVSNPAAQRINTGGVAPIQFPTLPSLDNTLKLGSLAVLAVIGWMVYREVR